MKQADFYDKLSGDQVRCLLCPHFCAIKDGRAGLCRVRKNLGGRLYSLVYGCPAAVNVDPIEKKPLFHFQPGSLSYSLGSWGCNFKCLNCQNWELSQASEIEKKIENFEKVSPEKIVNEALANDCSSLSCTYNEPAVFAEYALDIMKLARAAGLKNVWVSNGYLSGQGLKAILPYLDAANLDLKSIDHEFYKKNCGAKLAPVLDNLIAFKAAGVHLEITTLLIPGLSDDEARLKKLAEFIAAELGADTPWHVSGFSPAVSWKLKNRPATAEQAIFTACDIGKSAGLKYVYAGNLPGDERENTYCPACGQLAISRFGYRIERLDRHGRCPDCDKNLDIVE